MYNVCGNVGNSEMLEQAEYFYRQKLKPKCTYSTCFKKEYCVLCSEGIIKG